MDLCNLNEIKALLARHNFHFSKAKGQNFLTQAWVPQRIAEASGVDEDTGVLEVGPGIGCLTHALCQKAGKVCAVEVDTSLKPILQETLGQEQNLTLIFGDILKTDLPALVKEQFPGRRPMACANLPYYITSPILSLLLESRLFSSVTVMVQKEVAQRICAEAGSRDYSAFSVFCQYYAKPEFLFEVPASCFVPQPKVTSGVLKLELRSQPPYPVESEAMFFRTVRAGFAMRRKTLANALAAGFPKLGKEGVTQAILEAGLEPGIRCEMLDLEALSRLSNCLYRREANV